MLSVDNEDQLRKLAEKLENGGVLHTLIEEVDPPFTGQATAIGIEPTRDRRDIRKVVSHLPLLR